MNARKRWLSLSAYLRKAGLEQELRELPTKEFETLYRESITSRTAWISSTKA